MDIRFTKRKNIDYLQYKSNDNRRTITVPNNRKKLFNQIIISNITFFVITQKIETKIKHHENLYIKSV